MWFSSGMRRFCAVVSFDAEIAGALGGCRSKVARGVAGGEARCVMCC